MERALHIEAMSTHEWMVGRRAAPDFVSASSSSAGHSVTAATASSSSSADSAAAASSSPAHSVGHSAAAAAAATAAITPKKTRPQKVPSLLFESLHRIQPECTSMWWWVPKLLLALSLKQSFVSKAKGGDGDDDDDDDYELKWGRTLAQNDRERLMKPSGATPHAAAVDAIRRAQQCGTKFKTDHLSVLDPKRRRAHDVLFVMRCVAELCFVPVARRVRNMKRESSSSSSVKNKTLAARLKEEEKWPIVLDCLRLNTALPHAHIHSHNKWTDKLNVLRDALELPTLPQRTSKPNGGSVDGHLSDWIKETLLFEPPDVKSAHRALCAEVRAASRQMIGCIDVRHELVQSLGAAYDMLTKDLNALSTASPLRESMQKLQAFVICLFVQLHATVVLIIQKNDPSIVDVRRRCLGRRERWEVIAETDQLGSTGTSLPKLDALRFTRDLAERRRMQHVLIECAVAAAPLVATSYHRPKRGGEDVAGQKLLSLELTEDDQKLLAAIDVVDSNSQKSEAANNKRSAVLPSQPPPPPPPLPVETDAKKDGLMAEMSSASTTEIKALNPPLPSEEEIAMLAGGYVDGAASPARKPRTGISIFRRFLNGPAGLLIGGSLTAALNEISPLPSDLKQLVDSAPATAAPSVVMMQSQPQPPPPPPPPTSKSPATVVTSVSKRSRVVLNDDNDQSRTKRLKAAVPPPQPPCPISVIANTWAPRTCKACGSTAVGKIACGDCGVPSS
jgi:hypothetical protein